MYIVGGDVGVVDDVDGVDVDVDDIVVDAGVAVGGVVDVDVAVGVAVGAFVVGKVDAFDRRLPGVKFELILEDL